MGGQQSGFWGPMYPTSDACYAVLNAQKKAGTAAASSDCRGSDAGGSDGGIIRPPSGPRDAVIQGIFLGGGLGLLGGSLYDQTANGGVGGAGAMVAIYSATVPKIHPAARVVIGAGGGAAAGNAFAKYRLSTGKPDTIARDTALGAAGGAAMGFLGGFSRGKYGEAPKPLPAPAVYAIALGVGAGAGAAAGNVWKTPAGDPQAAVGSLGGAATTSTITLLAKAKDMAGAFATFAGAISGAAGGLAFGKWDYDRGNTDRRMMYTGIGAGAGAAIGFLASRGGHPHPSIGHSPRGRTFDPIIAGRYLGGIVRW